MAITSYGYDGSVAELPWSKMAPNLGKSYGVVAENDWKVTAVTSADRTVSIAPGTGFAKGVIDISDTAIQVQLPTIASGTRWDMIVANRNRSTNTTSFTYVTGSSTKSLPTRAVNDTVDQQPVALVQLTSGQTQPTSIVDLRAWQGEGGAQAVDVLALSYLDRVGSAIRIWPNLWRRSIDLSGAPVWVRENLGSFALLGAGAGLSPANFVVTDLSAVDFRIQAGTSVGTSDAAAYTRVTFPIAFPNGLLSFVCMNGDDVAANDLGFGISGSGPWGLGNKTDIVYRVWGPTGASPYSRNILPNLRHRVNWIAIGW